jgi:hypothetical protein
MKALIPFGILLSASIFISCNSRRVSPPTHTPKDSVVPSSKTLEDDRTHGFMQKSYYRDNLVEEMYGELIDKRADLKKIEEQIHLVNENDSLEAFNEYNDKSELYYSAARQMTESISDSSIRKKAQGLIAASIEKYYHKISLLDSLQKVIVVKKKDISNLHEYLKIASTLPLMEKYQHDKMPSEKTLKEKIKSQQEVIDQIRN